MRTIELYGKKYDAIKQVCDCGNVHYIPSVDIGTTKHWKCIPCLDRESREFELARPWIKKLHK